jgi:two-component system phosphate regulon sensor histidine kinase PhoR
MDDVNLSRMQCGHQVFNGITGRPIGSNCCAEISLSNPVDRCPHWFTATQHRIKGDPVHITNVLYNLIDNAVKYTAQEPRIEIHTSSKPGWMRIDFVDNGIGIDKENHKIIFEKFYRVPTGNLHSVRGYGLGLFYVKTIVEAHKGKISLVSEPNRGSTFSIEFKTL